MLAIMLASLETVGDVVVAGCSQGRDHLGLMSFGIGKFGSGGPAGSVQWGPDGSLNRYLVPGRPALIRGPAPINNCALNQERRKSGPEAHEIF
jgi:hypothetical protein